MFRSQSISVIAGTVLALVSAAHAGTILQYSAGIGVSGGPTVAGQSFTTPSGGPWNWIRFNFSSAADASPPAFGTAFLLSGSYSGTPAALRSPTPGFFDS